MLDSLRTSLGTSLGTSLRTSLHQLITTPRGDALALVRIQKDLARRLNMALGSPICSGEELARRRAAEERLRALRTTAAPETTTPVAAPVMVYFEAGRNERMLARVKETLAARGIVYTLLDVAGDEATLDFVTRTAKCEADELPVVFVGPTPVGGFDALVAFDVSGELVKAVFGR